jgi:hypothetical protein
MTTVAVLAAPPQSDVALSDLRGHIDDSAISALYTAMLKDVCVAVEASGADLLVNYRPAGDDDEAIDAAGAVRDAVTPVLSDPDSVRFEPQVGSSLSARVGNTVTHLLEQEGVRTAAVTTPSAPFLARQHVDSAAMKLRQAPVVLGPAPDGRVHYAAFADPVDFTDAFASNPLVSLTERGREAGLDVDFIEMLPVCERPSDLRTVRSLLEARTQAGTTVPEQTAAVVEELDLDGIREETD